MQFSVVIPTLARPAALRETLESVLACDLPPDDVIVVDADQERSAAGLVEPYGDRVRLLQAPGG